MFRGKSREFREKSEKLFQRNKQRGYRLHNVMCQTFSSVGEVQIKR